MGRPRKKTEEMPVIEVRPDLTDPSRVIVDRDGRNDSPSNVVQFTGGEQPGDQAATQSYNATAIDQFLVNYGVQIV